MMKHALTLIALAFAAPALPAVREPVEWVNAEIGTISHLLVPCFQTVQLPNAMLRFLPPNRDFTVDRVGPMHLQNPGHRAGGVFAFHPYSGDAEGIFADWSATWDQQHATPYSYDVFFDSCGVKFELVPATRSALATATFCRPDAVHALVFEADEVVSAGVEMRLTDTFRGRRGPVPVSAALQFSRAPEQILQNGRKTACVFKGEEPVSFRYAVSYVDTDQAVLNLRSEIADWDAKPLVQHGRDLWNAKLGKIEVEGGTDDERTVFYSSLWRCYERMVNISELDFTTPPSGRTSRYRGWDGKVHATHGVDQYADDWIWDTYRAQHPLMTILEPEAESAKLTSYIRMARQNKEKWMPSFPELDGDHHCMINHHVAIAFYDAWMKGIRDFDLAAAFEALDRTERTESLVPWYRGPLTDLDRFFCEKGYYPALGPGEKETCPHVDTGWEFRQAVSVTLGAGYDAWALAGLARELGNAAGADFYTRRARSFENLWDAETRFFRPRNAAGAFIEPFDPIRCGGRGGRYAYAENNAWTYIWGVPYALPRLRELLGGATGLAARLDEMLNVDVGCRFTFVNDMPDSSTGLMGVFTMANEPSFHVPYLYNYAGLPHKTQKFVRKTLEAWFRNDKMGMCGDEDGGGMCGYAVFSMMGFYPVTPGLPEYQIGSPVFSKTTIHLPNGKKFMILAPNASRDAKYWEKGTIGGKPLDGTVLRHDDLVAGQTLVLEMHDRIY